MGDSKLTFLESWNTAMFILAASAVVFSVLVYIYFKVSYFVKKTLKDKHDFVSKYEVKLLQISHFAIAVAIMLVANTYKSETVALSIVWFFIRFFIAVAIGTLYGYVAYLIFRYYYPTRVSKKLHKLRYTPRKNPKTGNKMKLLSEEEEDAYLDEGMQAEEDVFSVDYDVWIDEETGDTQIEKYDGRLKALECDRCGFMTLKLEKEEVLKPATAIHDGELRQHYKCTYCGRIRRKEVSLSKVNSEAEIRQAAGNRLDADPLHSHAHVTLVKMEIHDNIGESSTFEFQNIEEATRFLNEFKISKLNKD